MKNLLTVSVYDEISPERLALARDRVKVKTKRLRTIGNDILIETHKFVTLGGETSEESGNSSVSRRIVSNRLEELGMLTAFGNESVDLAQEGSGGLIARFMAGSAVKKLLNATDPHNKWTTLLHEGVSGVETSANANQIEGFQHESRGEFDDGVNTLQDRGKVNNIVTKAVEVALLLITESKEAGRKHSNYKARDKSLIDRENRLSSLGHVLAHDISHFRVNSVRDRNILGLRTKPIEEPLRNVEVGESEIGQKKSTRHNSKSTALSIYSIYASAHASDKRQGLEKIAEPRENSGHGRGDGIDGRRSFIEVVSHLTTSADKRNLISPV